ncbi:Phosphoserine phosphatase [Microbulbifer aggregans]|uniref:Phosphoserine phosphatase n=1 Tax=Microbulbifer aggregans TaxID=1769779 RepID=A0A1C9W6B1_9GAMM|nr:phosphoserine phosphatase SerB [Microbulbifer aggregans]AOS96692.1 Phosphoserine phosphatase [Microbulbifer aggregans]
MDASTAITSLQLSFDQITASSGEAALHYLEYQPQLAPLALLGIDSGGNDAFAGALELDHPIPAPPAASKVTAPWCLTLLSPAANLMQVRSVAEFIAAQGASIEAVDTLSRQRDCTVLRFQVRGELNFDETRCACLALAEEIGADLVLQAGDSQRPPSLAGFDMDSTLIDAEVIDELAKITGIGDQVAAITEAAMRGELDFRQSFKKRMRLLKGFPETELARIAPQLPLKPGAERLLRALRAMGCKTAILSGGFTYFANYLKSERLPIDVVHANELEFAAGVLTGEVIEPIVDGARKRSLLEEMAEESGLPLSRVVAVGDGANDIPMLSLGALGIAIHPKPKVRQVAPQSIDRFGLDAALYLFGLNDSQIAGLLGSD